MGANHGKLDPKDIDDLMRMTEFNGEEINEIYHQFRKDSSHNLIDRPTFVDKFGKIFPKSNSGGEFADHVFRSFDINRDGLLNFREFVIGLSLSYKAPLEDKLFWMFQLYDVNRSADVTLDEMECIMDALYRFTLKSRPELAESRDIFMKLDVNKDGRITWPEFRRGLLNNQELMTLLEL